LPSSDNQSGTDKSLAQPDDQHDHPFATGRRFHIQIAAGLLIQIVTLQPLFFGVSCHDL
jgi:hypothetical protein